MKVALIKPNIGRQEHSLYVDEGRMEPLQLGILAGLTPPDTEVVLFDDRCEEIDYDCGADLVAVTVETFTARRGYEIAGEFRKRGVPVVLGGFHPTLLPEEAAEHGDAIVVGDAEACWGELLDDFRQGRLKKRYEPHFTLDTQLQFPRRDLFEGKGYLPISLLQFGRGCPNSCTFCAISSFFQQSQRCRSIESVVAEIRAQSRKRLFFVDDNIVADREAAKELFRELIPLRIQWVSQGSIDMVQDRELMDLMVESGCLGNVIGFESVSPEALDGMQKGPNLIDFDQYDRAIAILKSYGLQTWAAFTLGHDADTKQGLYELLDFAKYHKFTFAAYNVLMPYPGTPLYSQLQAEGRLLYDGRWWTHPDYRFNHAAFVPKNMTAEELTEIAFDIRKRWNSLSSICSRFLDLRTNMRSLQRMMIFWLYNPLFRRETFKKQGMRFGLR